MLKEYVVCAEKIGDNYYYSVRANTDCSPVRFKVIKSFDTYEDANEYVHLLLLQAKLKNK